MMPERSAPRWLVPALTVSVVALLAARVWLAAGYGLTALEGSSVAESVTIMLAFSVYLVVGLLLVARRPENRLGWVLAAIGIMTCAGVLAESYARLALVERPEPLAGAVLAAWIHNWYWFPLLVLIVLFVPMLFPTGRPLTPRWNWLYYGAIALLSAITVISWLKPTLTDGNLRDPVYEVANPIGVAGIGDMEKSALGAALFAAVLVLAVCALVSLVVRFRRSRGVERQQMKLFVFAGFVMVALPVAEELGIERLLPESNVFFAIAVALPPIAIAVSVLRYRLYDIDRIISRTVSYALLSAVLLALYLTAVTVLTAVTAPVTRESPLAVAAATLAAAAAFGPARRRIQSAVDRRFNRARYDAARTVAAYRAALRDEVDIVALRSHLLAAVDTSVQPTGATLWLRDAPVEAS